MNTHERIDTGAREYIPARQNKTAAEIQREINLMRLAYADRMNANQHRRDRMIGWVLTIIGIVAIIAGILIYTL